MKKFLYPLPLIALLCAYLFSCSNDGFEKPNPGDLAGWAGLDTLDTRIVKCVIDENKPCYEISKSACNIIGGEEMDPEEKCISIDCGWTSKEVEYGQTSTLSFSINSDNQENCSGEVSYDNKPLEVGEHIISKSTFPGLSYFEDKSIVAKVSVACGEDKPIVQSCNPLTVKPVPIEFTCGWSPEAIKYGQKSTLSFDFTSNNIDQDSCSLKISPALNIGEHTISSSTIPGLSYSNDTILTATATVTCKGDKLPVKPCGELKIDSVPGPKWTGKLSFKKSDYANSDSNYFFIGTRVDTSFISNTLNISNKEEAECGSIKIKIDGSPAKLNTPVKATAVVYCKYTDTLELASISAKVLPDPVIKGCTFGDNSQYYMHRGESLNFDVTLDDATGRCDNGIEYSLNNGTTYGSSLSLSSSSGKLDKIKARAKCKDNFTTPAVDCPEIFVAEGYIQNARCNHENIFPSGITVTKTTTIIEYACCEPKSDYFITCGGKNYTLTVQGSPTVTASDGNANLPDLKLIPEYNKKCTPYGKSPGDTLYLYPKRILMTVPSNGLGNGGFSCDSW